MTNNQITSITHFLTRRFAWVIVGVILLVSAIYLYPESEQTIATDSSGRCKEFMFPERVPLGLAFKKLTGRDIAVGFTPGYRINLDMKPPSPQIHPVSEEEWENDGFRAATSGSPSQSPFTPCPDDAQYSVGFKGRSFRRSGKRWAAECIGKSEQLSHLVLISYDGRPALSALRMANHVGGTFFDFKYPAGVRYYFDIYSVDGAKLLTVTGNTGDQDIGSMSLGWYWVGEHILALRFAQRRSLLFCEFD